MMECWVTTGGGEKLTLPESVRWELCHGTGVPCDSFFVRCLWESGQERLLSGACRFYAQWEGERVFTGVVDEFACLCGADGLYLEMSGRGMAALLLDNEAMPAQYQLATRSDLVADHVSPYGVEAVGGWSLPAVSGFTVGSGVSEWSVVQEFACYHGGVVPRFDRWGRLVLDPHQDGGAGLRLTDAVPLTAWEYREERHGVLSQVAVRRRSSWDTQWVSDPDFIAQGGMARRVVTVPNATGSAAMRYSGQFQLRASRAERVRCEVTVPGLFHAFPGQLVTADWIGFAANGVYRVAETVTGADSTGSYTQLTLGETDILI